MVKDVFKKRPTTSYASDGDEASFGSTALLSGVGQGISHTGSIAKNEKMSEPILPSIVVGFDAETSDWDSAYYFSTDGPSSPRKRCDGINREWLCLQYLPLEEPRQDQHPGL